MHTTADIASLPLQQDSAMPPGRAARSWPWSRPPQDQPASCWQLMRFVTAALLVLTVAGSAIAVAAHRPSRLEVSPVHAASSQPSATPPAASGPVVEFLWEADGGPSFPLDGPTGMAVDAQGNLWVTDGGNGRFVIFSPEGVALEAWGAAGSGDGEFNFACTGTRFGGVAFDAHGNIYVADSGNGRIQTFAPDRTFLASWRSEGVANNQMLDTGRGGQGTADDLLLCPVALAVDGQSHVFVSDRHASTIEVFGPDGRPLVTIPVESMQPEAVALDRDGDVWVADTSSRILQFAPAGKLRTTWDTAILGAGQLNTPMGIAVDAQDRVFVSDWSKQVQLFAPNGAFLGAWGSRGLATAHFEDPVAVTLDGHGHVYVADHFGDRVQAFRLLPPFAPK